MFQYNRIYNTFYNVYVPINFRMFVPILTLPKDITVYNHYDLNYRT